jgi:hypothetical protein
LGSSLQIKTLVADGILESGVELNLVVLN